MNGVYRRNEFIYVGRSTSGAININSVSVHGKGARYFSVSTSRTVLHQNEFARITVRFRSKTKVSLGDLRPTHVDIKYGPNNKLARILMLG